MPSPETYPIYSLDDDSVSSIYELYPDHIYYFDTDKEVRFFVRFNRAGHYFKEICSACQQVYEVSFESVKKNRGVDEKIKNTISEIIRLWLVKSESPIMFTCDSLDSLNICRNRLFKKWYSDWDQKEIFQMQERTIVYDDYILNLGLIAYSWDPDIKIYLQEIDEGLLG